MVESDSSVVEQGQTHEDRMEFTSAAATIDPCVVSSRIFQSTSLHQQTMQYNNANSVNNSKMSASDAQREEQQRQLEGGNKGEEEQPHFPKLSAIQASGNKVEYRRVRCPPHRYTPLREHWEQILTPLVEFLKLQVSG